MPANSRWDLIRRLRVNFSVLDVFFLCHSSSSLRAAPSVVLWNIRASSAFSSRRVETSPSACRPSSALKREVVLCLLALLLVRSALFSSPHIINFSSISANVCAIVSRLFKLFVRVPYTGIRIIVIDAASEHGKLEY